MTAESGPSKAAPLSDEVDELDKEMAELNRELNNTDPAVAFNDRAAYHLVLFSRMFSEALGCTIAVRSD